MKDVTIPEADIVEAERVTMEVLWALLTVSGDGEIGEHIRMVKKIEFVLADLRDGRALPEEDFQVIGISPSGVTRVPPNRVNVYQGIE